MLGSLEACLGLLPHHQKRLPCREMDVQCCPEWRDVPPRYSCKCACAFPLKKTQLEGHRWSSREHKEEVSCPAESLLTILGLTSAQLHANWLKKTSERASMQSHVDRAQCRDQVRVHGLCRLPDQSNSSMSQLDGMHKACSDNEQLARSLWRCL